MERHKACAQAGIGLVMLARLYRRALDAAMKPYGLSEATAMPFRYLAYHGADIRQGALADAMHLEGPTLVRVLDRLVESGFVERIEDEGDRRARLVRMTPAGKALNKELDAVAEAVRAEIFAGVAEADLAAALRMFGQLERNLLPMKALS